MSDSKWTHRDFRTTSVPRDRAEPPPRFRREHQSHRSRRTSPGKQRYLRRLRFKRFEKWTFVAGIVASCIIVVVSVVVHLRNISGGSRARGGIAPVQSVGELTPEVVIHNPVPVVERFLRCTAAAEIAPLCRTDDNSAELAASHSAMILDWLAGRSEWRPLHEVAAGKLMFTVFSVAHRCERPRSLYVVQTPDGPRVDLGAFLAWSSSPWSDLVDGRVTSAAVVRTSAVRDSYYNLRFHDEARFQCYRLEAPDRSEPIHGYVERGTPTAAALQILVQEGKAFPVALSLDEGESSPASRQFRITRLLATGWAIGSESVEDYLARLARENRDKPSTPAPVEPE